jgi:hypothetical protein
MSKSKTLNRKIFCFNCKPINNFAILNTFSGKMIFLGLLLLVVQTCAWAADQQLFFEETLPILKEQDSNWREMGQIFQE